MGGKKKTAAATGAATGAAAAAAAAADASTSVVKLEKRPRRRRVPVEEGGGEDGGGGGGGPKKKKKVRLAQQSTAEYAANIGATLADSVPESRREARVLHARDYRGIHLFADPTTGAVYDPDDIMARVLDPRELDPALVARLGPWVPSTGLSASGGVEVCGDDFDQS